MTTFWNIPPTHHPRPIFVSVIIYMTHLTLDSYEKCLFIGDLKREVSELRVDPFVYEPELHDLVKRKHFKSVHNPK